MLRAKIEVWIIIILTVLAAHGCAVSTPDVTPEVLSTHGLLVGRVTFIHTNGNALPFNGYAVVDGKKHERSVKNGYLLLALKPGTHKLSTLDRFDVKYRSTYPVKRTVTIRAGRATNIGHVVMLADRKQEKKFRILFIDNDPYMAGHLKADYPAVYGALTNKRMISVPGKKLAPEKIKAVRAEIARRTIDNKDALSWRSGTFGERRYYLTGELGTLVTFQLDKRNKLEKLEIIETDTLSLIFKCSGKTGRLACIVHGPYRKYVGLLGGGTLRKYPLPTEFGYSFVHLFGRRGIAVVDNHFSTYTSRNNGNAWKKDGRYRTENGVIGYRAVQFRDRKGGFTAYSRYTKSGEMPTLFYRSNTGRYTTVDAP